jgi:hypothetical protein
VFVVVPVGAALALAGALTAAVGAFLPWYWWYGIEYSRRGIDSGLAGVLVTALSVLVAASGFALLQRRGQAAAARGAAVLGGGALAVLGVFEMMESGTQVEPYSYMPFAPNTWIGLGLIAVVVGGVFAFFGGVMPQSDLARRRTIVAVLCLAAPGLLLVLSSVLLLFDLTSTAGGG